MCVVIMDTCEAHRVEGEVVDDGRQPALFEQSGMGLYIRSLRHKHRGDRPNNEYSKADSSTSRHTDTVTHDQTEKLGTEERGIVGGEGWQANLARDVFEAIDGRGADTFSPDGKNETNIVDPLIDTFQVEISKACAVWQ